MGVKTVLCVDDEVNILNSIKRLLFMEDYELLTANSADEALELLGGCEAQLVVSDHRMPRMTGIELLQKVKEINPMSVRVILSGHVDVNIIVDSINKGEVYRFVTKPWNDEELKSTIRQCLDHYDMSMANLELTRRVQEQNEQLRRMNGELEQVVLERTFYLRMSQDLLDDLPIPVVGMDDRRRLILCNRQARESLPSLSNAIPGNDVAAIFPAAAAAAINGSLDALMDVDVGGIVWDGRVLRLQTKILMDKRRLRGCVALLHLNPTISIGH